MAPRIREPAFRSGLAGPTARLAGAARRRGVSRHPASRPAGLVSKVGNARTRETADVVVAGATVIAAAATATGPDSHRAELRMPSRPCPRTTFSFRSQE